jgi:hypothetical protein
MQEYASKYPRKVKNNSMASGVWDEFSIIGCVALSVPVNFKKRGYFWQFRHKYRKTGRASPKTGCASHGEFSEPATSQV